MRCSLFLSHVHRYLALPQINVIHCDLKPENILLRSPRHSAIKVIDLGSSCRADKKLCVWLVFVCLFFNLSPESFFPYLPCLLN
jgi:serine/threonine protein kinase